MNNVLEVKSHHQEEEIKEEALAYVKIAMPISNKQDDTMKEEPALSSQPGHQQGDRLPQVRQALLPQG